MPKTQRVSLRALSDADRRRIDRAYEAKRAEDWKTARRRWSALASRLTHGLFWYEIAICDFFLGRSVEALRAARIAARLSPRAAVVQSCLGSIALKLRRFREAEAALRKAVRRRSDPVTYCLLAQALEGRGRTQAARRAFLAALRVDPRYEEAHLNLGIYARLAGRRKLAIRHLRRAIELDPRYAEAFAQLGAVTLKSSPGEAVRYLRRAIQLKPGDDWSHLRLAIAEWELGRLDHAERCFENALRAAPKEAVVLWSFGEFLSSMNRDRARAGRLLARALRIEPDNRWARRFMRNHLARLPTWRRRGTPCGL